MGIATSRATFLGPSREIKKTNKKERIKRGRLGVRGDDEVDLYIVED